MPQGNKDCPPLMKVTFSSTELRNTALSRKMNLKENSDFKDVHICPSLPLEARIYGNHLRKVALEWNKKAAAGSKYVSVLNYYSKTYELRCVRNERLDWKTKFQPSDEDLKKAENLVESERKQRQQQHKLDNQGNS